MEKEILTEDNPNRFVLFPIKYPDVWEQYKLQMSKFWTVEELDLNQDILDWKYKLNNDEKYFIKNILAFFSASDGIVLENLLSRFSTEIQIPEIRCFYSFQGMMENIHSETYSLLIDTYIDDEKEKNHLFNSLETIPEITEKGKWAMKWIADKKSSLGQRLIAFSIVEGIFFSGAFCSIFWLKSRGLMPGLCFSNELISRDERLHTDFAVLLYTKYIKNKLEQKVVHNIFKEAVEIELNFINKSIPCNLIGMNDKLMGDYVKYVADYLLTQLNYDKIFNIKNPFKFMENISIERKSNFFERRVGEYNMALVGSSKEDMQFSLDEDF